MNLVYLLAFLGDANCGNNRRGDGDDLADAEGSSGRGSSSHDKCSLMEE